MAVRKAVADFAKYLLTAYEDFIFKRGFDEGILHLNPFILLEVSTRFLWENDNIIATHNITYVDKPKQAGFVTYWICRLKPITWSGETSTNGLSALDYQYVNEMFAVYASFGILLPETGTVAKRLNLNNAFGKDFTDTFQYTIRYHTISGYGLSLIYYLLHKKLEDTVTLIQLADSSLIRMAKSVDARDNETGAHLARTHKYMRILLSHLMDNSPYCEQLQNLDLEHTLLAARVHDVGKMEISDDILKKPGKLTAEEYEKIKQHVDKGVEIIMRDTSYGMIASFLAPAVVMAGFHHENWDGSGYPKGLAGNNIPLLGRVMAIIDVYDALTSKRAYKPAFTHDDAVNNIINDSGKKYDPGLIEVFKKVSAYFNKI